MKSRRTVPGAEGVPLLQHIARQIYRLRTEARLTQDDLGNQVGTSGEIICRLEKARKWPNLATVYRLAQALGRELQVEFVLPEAEQPVAEWEAEGYMSGDHECFCMDVPKEEFIRLTGREPQHYNQSHFQERLPEGTPPLYRVYPDPFPQQGDYPKDKLRYRVEVYRVE